MHGEWVNRNVDWSQKVLSASFGSLVLQARESESDSFSFKPAINPVSAWLVEQRQRGTDHYVDLSLQSSLQSPQ
jgi:hypothetical protein